jgi:hypothetical protein
VRARRRRQKKGTSAVPFRGERFVSRDFGGSARNLFEHFQADLASGDFAQGGHARLVLALDLGVWPWLSMRAR